LQQDDGRRKAADVVNGANAGLVRAARLALMRSTMMDLEGNGMHRRDFIAGCLGLPLLAQTTATRAQAGLTRIIFPFAAGAGGDTLCRLIAQEMAPVLQRTIVVENRTGGDGLIGIKAVKGASPDGSMVLVTTGPTMYLLPMVETAPSFDTAKDFVPVSLLARFEFAVVIGPAIGAKDFGEFVAWLKAHPDQATFGVPSNGTIPHFMGSKLEKDLGIPLNRVPYRGSAPILNDIIGGHLPFGITTLADALPQHRAKGVKIIAVSSAERSPFAPDVPTLKESGIDLAADAWYGMWLPAGTPPELSNKLSAAASAALAKPDVKEKLTAIGLIPVGSPPEGLTNELAANIALWQPVVKATGYRIEN
jgi:tripartite-type tricarboxylate transporter receptor subunit TctC